MNSSDLTDAEREELRFAFAHYRPEYDEGSRAYEVVAQIVAEREKRALRAAADRIGPFHGAVLVGPTGDAFCAGWDAALAAIRELADQRGT